MTPPPYETAAVEQQQQQRKGWWKFGGGGASKKEKEKETASSIEIAKEMEETKLNDLDRIIDEIPMEHSKFFVVGWVGDRHLSKRRRIAIANLQGGRELPLDRVVVSDGFP
ncbi:unnamed protein product, partial [Anisakis simplex]